MSLETNFSESNILKPRHLNTCGKLPMIVREPVKMHAYIYVYIYIYIYTYVSAHIPCVVALPADEAHAFNRCIAADWAGGAIRGPALT